MLNTRQAVIVILRCCNSRFDVFVVAEGCGIPQKSPSIFGDLSDLCFAHRKSQRFFFCCVLVFVCFVCSVLSNLGHTHMAAVSGTLVITKVRGSNLPAEDVGGTSDPYFVIKYVFLFLCFFFFFFLFATGCGVTASNFPFVAVSRPCFC